MVVCARPENGPVDIRIEAQVERTHQGNHEVEPVLPGPVESVDRVSVDISVKVSLPTGKTDDVLRQPAPYNSVVVSGAEVDEAGVRIVEASGEPVRLKAGGSIVRDVAPLVIIDALSHIACIGVDHDARASNDVLDDSVSYAT